MGIIVSFLLLLNDRSTYSLDPLKVAHYKAVAVLRLLLVSGHFVNFLCSALCYLMKYEPIHCVKGLIPCESPALLPGVPVIIRLRVVA